MIILEKNSYENARAYAFRVLLYNIVNIELEPGTAISENEISSVLNLSRTPVREALIELNKYGLVDIQPQRGSYISKIDYNIIEESRFMRVVLEIAILKLACVDIPPEYIIRLKGNIAEQKLCIEQNNSLKLLSLDNEFHKLIFEAVGKQWTYNVISTQMVHFDRLRVLILKTIKNNRTVEDHENILYAIERHDKELAEMLMTKHLDRHTLDKDELIKLYPDYFV